MRNSPRSAKLAFSLVEVTLALGIASFALLAVFGLLPIGLTSNRTSLEQTSAASILTAIVADLRAAPPLVSGETTSRSPVYQIEVPSVSGQTICHLYCAEDGSLSSPTNAKYLVSVGITPPTTAGQRSATAVRVLVSWPAAAHGSPQPNQWPTQSVGSLEAFTTLNRN
jgi:hypothetical protein